MGNQRFSRFLPFAVIAFGLSGCATLQDWFANFDLDLRNNAGGFDTSDAARNAVQTRPEPDARGVISYESYQVAVAQRGDTVEQLASRVGVPVDEIARFNGLQPGDRLNAGEIVALPRGVTAPSTELAPGAPGSRDVAAIATTALDRAETTGGATMTRAVPSRRIDGPEPIQHQVAAGETAFSIARLYNVSVRALNNWNGLGPDLEVRTGQYLLIPLVQAPEAAAPAPVTTSPVVPGAGTVAPLPPSSTQPLPPPEPAAKPAPPEPEPQATRLQPPVTGAVLRPYKRGSNEGLDISASAGTAVKAADAGEVAAITRDTNQVPILVLRHSGNLLTVYANISDLSVKKGDTVQRGQTIARVASGDPSFLHFEVREGFESVNPSDFITP